MLSGRCIVHINCHIEKKLFGKICLLNLRNLAYFLLILSIFYLLLTFYWKFTNFCLESFIIITKIGQNWKTVYNCKQITSASCAQFFTPKTYQHVITYCTTNYSINLPLQLESRFRHHQWSRNMIGLLPHRILNVLIDLINNLFGQ